MAVISVEYDDVGDNEFVYEGVSIHYGNDKKSLFHSGLFVKDWYDCIKFIITEGLDEHIANSSSVDHFFMDIGGYDSAYLKTNNNTPRLEYEYDHDDAGIKLFVPPGTRMTWEELRKYCGDEMKQN